VIGALLTTEHTETKLENAGKMTGNSFEKRWICYSVCSVVRKKGQGSEVGRMI